MVCYASITEIWNARNFSETVNYALIATETVRESLNNTPIFALRFPQTSSCLSKSKPQYALNICDVLTHVLSMFVVVKFNLRMISTTKYCREHSDFHGNFPSRSFYLYDREPKNLFRLHSISLVITWRFILGLGSSILFSSDVQSSL